MFFLKYVFLIFETPFEVCFFFFGSVFLKDVS